MLPSIQLTSSTFLLAGRLVEPGPHTDDLVPFLLEVLVGDYVVVTHHFGSPCNMTR